MRTYSELILLPTFEERFEYCKLNGLVSEPTFGYDRYLNQIFYKTPEWRSLRNRIILRDNGCDLADPDHPLDRYVYIHHLNPITKKDILDRSPFALDPENLICVSKLTHDAIHFSSADLLPKPMVERRPGDTCPWKN